MMINKITTSVDYNEWLERLDTQLNDPANQNSIKGPKVVKPIIRELYYKTLGTSVINICSKFAFISSEGTF